MQSHDNERFYWTVKSGDMEEYGRKRGGGGSLINDEVTWTDSGLIVLVGFD